MAHEYLKDLPGRIASNKVLHDKGHNIAKNPKYDRHRRALASVVNNFFDKTSLGRAVTRAWRETLDTRDKSAV